MSEASVHDYALRQGASPSLAQRLAERWEPLARALEANAPATRGEAVAVYVPGRIEIVGKHADYVGGTSIVCAAERGMLVLARPRPDTVVRVTDVDRGTQVRYDLAALPTHTVGSWGLYLLAVLRRLTLNFPDAIGGLEATISSDLPSAAGLSSSSALVTACVLAWAHALGLPRSERFRSALPTTVELATYLGCVENGHDFRGLPGERGVGTQGGCQDHVAIVCSEPGKLTRWNYVPTQMAGACALPPDLTFAVVSSGVAARKTGSARDDFNRLAALGAELTRLARAATGRPGTSLVAALMSDADAIDTLRSQLDGGAGRDFTGEELAQRLSHVVRESLVLVPAAWTALQSRDWPAFAEAVASSQESADSLLGNQVPETRELVRLAKANDAIAASAFGAGFGGSVWALVPAARAERFMTSWLEEYRQAFPGRRDRSQGFLTQPGPPAFVLGL